MCFCFDLPPTTCIDFPKRVVLFLKGHNSSNIFQISLKVYQAIFSPSLKSASSFKAEGFIVCQDQHLCAVIPDLVLNCLQRMYQGKLI